jgi:hypothetical protein
MNTYGSHEEYFAMVDRENAREARERQICAAKCPHGVSVNKVPCPLGGEECDAFMTEA